MKVYPIYRVGEIVWYSYEYNRHECVVRKVVHEPNTKHEYGLYIISSTTNDEHFRNSGPYEIDGVMYPGNQCASMYIKKREVIKPTKQIVLLHPQ